MAIKQSDIARCPKCKKIIVTWNWFGPMPHVQISDKGKKKEVTFNDDWTHECWICESTFSTPNEITNGVPYEACKVLWDLYEAGKPVVYTEAMKVLYDPESNKSTYKAQESIKKTKG